MSENQNFLVVPVGQPQHPGVQGPVEHCWRYSGTNLVEYETGPVGCRTQAATGSHARGQHCGFSGGGQLTGAVLLEAASREAIVALYR